MTCLVNLIVGQNHVEREFCELVSKVSPGDCVRVRGRICRVLALVHNSGDPIDPRWLNCGLEPVLDWAVELIALPVTVESLVSVGGEQ